MSPQPSTTTTAICEKTNTVGARCGLPAGHYGDHVPGPCCGALSYWHNEFCGRPAGRREHGRFHAVLSGKLADGSPDGNGGWARGDGSDWEAPCGEVGR